MSSAPPVTDALVDPSEFAEPVAELCAAPAEVDQHGVVGALTVGVREATLDRPRQGRASLPPRCGVHACCPHDHGETVIAMSLGSEWSRFLWRAEWLCIWRARNTPAPRQREIEPRENWWERRRQAIEDRRTVLDYLREHPEQRKDFSIPWVAPRARDRVLRLRHGHHSAVRRLLRAVQEVVAIRFPIVLMTVY